MRPARRRDDDARDPDRGREEISSSAESWRERLGEVKPPHLSVEDAYRNDMTFRTVVDAIEAMIHNAQITPAEARSAAVLACIHYESRNLRLIHTGRESLNEVHAMESRISDLKRWLEVDGNHPYRSGEKGGRG